MIKEFSSTCRQAVMALAIAGGMALLGAAPAAAQGTAAQRAGCEADAFRFCSAFIPIVHEIENCLYRNMRNLTPACRRQMQGGATPRPRR